jgi:hypothetical protein
MESLSRNLLFQEIKTAINVNAVDLISSIGIYEKQLKCNAIFVCIIRFYIPTAIARRHAQKN